MGAENEVLRGGESAAGRDLTQQVVDAAEAYVDALYGAKFAKSVAINENSSALLEARALAVTAARVLVAAVAVLRGSREPKKLIVP